MTGKFDSVTGPDEHLLRVGIMVGGWMWTGRFDRLRKKMENGLLIHGTIGEFD